MPLALRIRIYIIRNIFVDMEDKKMDKISTLHKIMIANLTWAFFNLIINLDLPFLLWFIPAGIIVWIITFGTLTYINKKTMYPEVDTAYNSN